MNNDRHRAIHSGHDSYPTSPSSADGREVGWSHGAGGGGGGGLRGEGGRPRLTVSRELCYSKKGDTVVSK